MGFDLPDFLKPESLSRQQPSTHNRIDTNQFSNSNAQIFLFGGEEHNGVVTQAELAEPLEFSIRTPLEFHRENVSSFDSPGGTKVDATLARDFEQFLLRKGIW